MIGASKVVKKGRGHFSSNSPSISRKIDFFRFSTIFCAFFDQKIVIFGATWRFQPWDRFLVLGASKVVKKGRGHFSSNSPSFSRKIDFFDFLTIFCAFFDQKNPHIWSYVAISALGPISGDWGFKSGQKRSGTLFLEFPVIFEKNRFFRFFDHFLCIF